MSRRRGPLLPSDRLLRRLARNGVRYVMVGMDGFNQWVPIGQHAIETYDSDLCILPERRNIERLLRSLWQEKFVVIVTDGTLEGSREPNLGRAGEVGRTAAAILRRRLTVVAEHPDLPHTFEFPMRIAGYDFETLEQDSILFARRPAPLRVAQIGKILRSKRLANRKKDRAFFEKYALLIDDAIHAAKTLPRRSG